MFGLFGEDCGQVVREDIGSSLVALLSASAAGERKVAAAFNTFPFTIIRHGDEDTMSAVFSPFRQSYRYLVSKNFNQKM